MVKEVMTSNKAVAEAVRLAKPQVIPVYPITPQTTISEYLAQYVADEKIDAKYVKVESEHSAISAAVGASGAGVRVFTATSSQGLMLMHEILFAAAGMRTPFVFCSIKYLERSTRFNCSKRFWLVTNLCRKCSRSIRYYFNGL